MIRLFCDRCMSEIYGKGYNVKICEDTGMNALYNVLNVGTTIKALECDLDTHSDIYCKDCVDEIERYINIKGVRYTPFKE